MMRCHQCLREIADGSYTCPYCGKDLSSQYANGANAMPPYGASGQGFTPPYGQPVGGAGQQGYNPSQPMGAPQAPQNMPPQMPPVYAPQPPMPQPPMPQPPVPQPPVPQQPAPPVYPPNAQGYGAAMQPPLAQGYPVPGWQQQAQQSAPQPEMEPHKIPFLPPPEPVLWPPQNGFAYPQPASLGTGLKGVPACTPENGTPEVQYMRAKADFRRGVNDHVPGVVVLTNYRLVFMQLSKREVLTYGVMADYAEGSYMFDIPLSEVCRVDECVSQWRYAVLVNADNFGTMLYFKRHDEWMGALQAVAAPYIKANAPQQAHNIEEPQAGAMPVFGAQAPEESAADNVAAPAANDVVIEHAAEAPVANFAPNRAPQETGAVAAEPHAEEGQAQQLPETAGKDPQEPAASEKTEEN